MAVHNLLGLLLYKLSAINNWMKILVPWNCQILWLSSREGGAAKTFMVRENAFSDVDINYLAPRCLAGVVKGSS